MLVLSRKRGERVIFEVETEPGKPMTIISVSVVESRASYSGGGAVRLGITAPPNVKVWRHEIWPRREEVGEEHQAANTDTGEPVG